MQTWSPPAKSAFFCRPRGSSINCPPVEGCPADPGDITLAASRNTGFSAGKGHYRTQTTGVAGPASLRSAQGVGRADRSAVPVPCRPVGGGVADATGPAVAGGRPGPDRSQPPVGGRGYRHVAASDAGPQRADPPGHAGPRLPGRSAAVVRAGPPAARGCHVPGCNGRLPPAGHARSGSGGAVVSGGDRAGQRPMCRGRACRADPLGRRRRWFSAADRQLRLRRPGRPATEVDTTVQADRQAWGPLDGLAGLFGPPASSRGDVPVRSGGTAICSRPAADGGWARA